MFNRTCRTRSKTQECFDFWLWMDLNLPSRTILPCKLQDKRATSGKKFIALLFSALNCSWKRRPIVLIKLYIFFLSLETSTVAVRTVLDELLCFFFCPEFDILPIFFQESFVFAFSFAFRRKFAPKIPAKFPRNRPFSPRICLFKSREISLFFPRIIRSPDL